MRFISVELVEEIHRAEGSRLHLEDRKALALDELMRVMDQLQLRGLDVSYDH